MEGRLTQMILFLSCLEDDASPSPCLFCSLSDDLADDLGDVDFEDPGNADDEGWETEDEMEAEAEQDDSEFTFSRHNGSTSICGVRARVIIRRSWSVKPKNLSVQARCSA